MCYPDLLPRIKMLPRLNFVVSVILLSFYHNFQQKSLVLREILPGTLAVWSTISNSGAQQD